VHSDRIYGQVFVLPLEHRGRGVAYSVDLFSAKVYSGSSNRKPQAQAMTRVGM
jgi:hypothetical protein